MKIENFKTPTIKQQQVFKGNEKEEETDTEESSNAGKIALALGGLAALGGAVILIAKHKNKGAKKAVEENIVKPTEIAARAEETARKAEEKFQELLEKKKERKEFRDNTAHILANSGFHCDKPERKKLLNLAKRLDADAFLLRRDRNNHPNIVLIEGKNPLRNHKFSQSVGSLVNSTVYRTDIEQKPQDTLQYFYSGLSKMAHEKTFAVHILPEADEVFARLKSAVPQEEYDSAVQKLADEIKTAQSSNKTTILLTAKDKNALPEAIRALIPDKTSFKTKEIAGKIPNKEPRSANEIASFAPKFYNTLSPEAAQILASRFDEADFSGTLAPSRIQLNVGPSEIPQILENLGELTRAKVISAPKEDLAHDKIFDALEKLKSQRAQDFTATGEKTVFYIGDLSDLFSDAQKTLGNDGYKQFRSDFIQKTNDANEAGISVLYNVFDPAKFSDKRPNHLSTLNLDNRVEQNWGLHHPHTYEQIKTGTKKVEQDLENPDSLYGLGRRYKGMYATNNHDPDSGMHRVLGIGIFGTDSAKIERILDALPEITSSKLVKVDGENGFYEAKKEAQAHFDKTGQQTLIYVGDYDQIAFPDGKIGIRNDGRPTEGEYFLSGIMDTVYPGDQKPYRAIVSKKDETDIHPKMVWRLNSRLILKAETPAQE